MKLIQTNSLEYEKLLLNISVGRISFLSFNEKKILINNLDSPSHLALLSIEDIEKIVGRKFSKRAQWNAKQNLLSAKAVIEKCKALNIQIIFYFDDLYPPLFKEIADPPFMIYARGETSLLMKTCVSVVGTRRLSQMGKKAAFSFSYDATLSGMCVVSGLANGADGYAHEGSISAFFDCKQKGLELNRIGRTIAVLPSAIDEIVPYCHKKLACQVLQTGGLLISEYEPGCLTEKWHFVARNRIIAALSAATVVIEAPSGSGALITADFAVEYNRELFFHEVAFCDHALQIAQIVKSDLEKEAQKGKVSTYKLENQIKKFIDDGALVIKNFEDFCEKILNPHK